MATRMLNKGTAMARERLPLKRERLPLERERLPAERERLDFVPQWEGPIEGYTVKYIDRSQWRVQPELDFEDLYQEAFMLFLRMGEAYPHVVDPQHFMALYKAGLHNMVVNLACRRTRRHRHETAAVRGYDEKPAVTNLSAVVTGSQWGKLPEALQAHYIEQGGEYVLKHQPVCGQPLDTKHCNDYDAELRLLLLDAPEVVQRLAQIVEENNELPQFERIDGQRETTEQWLARVSGLAGVSGLAATLRAWLTGEVVHVYNHQEH